MEGADYAIAVSRTAAYIGVQRVADPALIAGGLLSMGRGADREQRAEQADAQGSALRTGLKAGKTRDKGKEMAG
ncbi:hypothetical protein D3C71_1863710 [compost metagenome]